jgi:ELWxxDGT repeat protein
VPGTVSSILVGGAANQTSIGTYATTATFVPTDTSNYNSLTTVAAGNFVIINQPLLPFMLADINAMGLSSSPQFLTTIGSTLFFSATDATNGRELWKSDGTTAGTVLVKDIRNGVSGSNPRYLTNVNGTLYFNAYDDTNASELWKSDGTIAGTVLVKDINNGVNHSSPRYLINVNGTLYFNADNGTNGSELWKSDGTTAGTVLIKDINIAISRLESKIAA